MYNKPPFQFRNNCLLNEWKKLIGVQFFSATECFLAKCNLKKQDWQMCNA